MKLCERSILVASVMSCMLCTFSANAEVEPRANFGKLYIGLGAGGVVPQSTEWKLSGNVTGSGNINYESGPAVFGKAGYHFSKYLTGEAQFGYASIGYDNISGTLTAGDLGTGSGSIGIDGDIDAVIGMFNGIVTPLGLKGFSPFLGGGLGFATVESKINSLTFKGNTKTLNSENSETDFAVNALAGANYSFTDNFSIGARYQYLWINSEASASGNNVTAKEDNFAAHVLMAQFRYTF